MASRVLVSGLPRSLPPLPPGPGPTCVPCVKGRQRAAPHSSEFPPTEAPLQTLHMDVWGPARVSGQGRERYFLLVIDDYSRYTTIFPLRSKGDVTEVLIDWIRAARLQLRESFGSDFPVLRLHSDRGGEFSSARLGAFCRAQGIRQTFTLPASPQQNGIAERRIGMVMDVARTSMMHAAAPHFLWPFGVQYAAYQLNLQPRAFVRDLSADKLSPRVVPCVFLGFPPDAPGWQFYHPTTRRVLSSQDVTFDESVPYYRLFDYRTAPLPPPPLFLASGATQVDPLPPQGPAPSGVSQVDVVEPVEVAVDYGAARGAEPAGAGSTGAGSGGAEFGGAETRGAERGGAESGGAEPGGAGSARRRAAESGGVDAGVSTGASGGAAEAADVDGPTGVGAAGAGAPGGVGDGVPTGGGASGGAAKAAGADGPTGVGAAGARAARGVGAGVSTRADGPTGVGAAGAGAAGGVGAGGAAGAGASEGTRVGAVGAGGSAGAGAAAGGTGAVLAGSRGAARPRPYFVPLLEQSFGHAPSCYCRHCPSFESAAAFALVGELVDFAARCRVDYATSLVAESESVCPPSVGGECALSTDVLEDRHEEFQCFAAALPHLVSTLIAPEGDADAPDIPTPRSYAEAIEGPYSSQWQSAMDAEMASWKSTGTYVDEVPPPGANIVSGMWIFRVKWPPGSPPVFKARYVARGFSQRHGVDYFQTFSPTPKMTTLRVLLHIAAQRDYELHFLDFSTAFLQGSLHEEIWLRRPPGFTGSFPPGTQWSLRRPVYGLRQAPREWHDILRTTLAALGFAPSTANPSLFLRTDTPLPPFYILVYVDDLVFATAETAGLAHMKSELQKRHTCTDLEHMAAAKRVLRYVCSTSGMGLVLGGRRRVVLTGHADASWADDQATQRSSQGYTFSLGSGSVSWRSTRSSSVLGSSCEAEIYAGAMATQELRWLTYLLTDLGEPPRSPPVLYVDNKAMLALCREHRLEHRTKHIALRYFLSRELQQCGQLRLTYVASEANTADIFTKALPRCDHQHFCTVLGLVPTWPHLLTS
ncbi:unnamed protein product [Closterium sp. NIES-64]|nr:unnamed protein product [Closterium sp. NIES-64]